MLLKYNDVSIKPTEQDCNTNPGAYSIHNEFLGEESSRGEGENHPQEEQKVINGNVMVFHMPYLMANKSRQRAFTQPVNDFLAQIQFAVPDERVDPWQVKEPHFLVRIMLTENILGKNMTVNLAHR